MKNSGIPYEERELIQRAIGNARPTRYASKLPRWALVKNIFRTGKEASRAICTHYGFDPDLEISGLTPILELDYRENLLQHGVVDL